MEEEESVEGIRMRTGTCLLGKMLTLYILSSRSGWFDDLAIEVHWVLRPSSWREAVMK